MRVSSVLFAPPSTIPSLFGEELPHETPFVDVAPMLTAGERALTIAAQAARQSRSPAAAGVHGRLIVVNETILNLRRARVARADSHARAATSIET